MDSRVFKRLYKELKQQHPELLGLGFGWRSKGGRVQKAPAIKLVVGKKRSARAKSVRQFPCELEIVVSRGKRPLRLKVHTDVEESGKWVYTSFPVSIDGKPTVTAACYARWSDPAGGDYRGVVTVAHAFQASGQSVEIAAAGGGVTPGVVYVRSDLIADGLDVGLLQLTNPGDNLLPCLPSDLNPGAASVSSTINLLGLSDTDALYANIQSWYSDAPATGRGLAYYYVWNIQNVDGTSYDLSSVVMADGPQGTFGKGRSGSPWVALGSGWAPLCVALQSQSKADSGFRLGLGTHLATALEWLSGRPNIRNFTWAWRLADL